MTLQISKKIVLDEISQTQESTYHMIYLISLPERENYGDSH